MENNKKNKIIVGVSIALLVIIVIGATYAYLASQKDKSKAADINITADTTDTLLFKAGKELSLKATTENFTNGGSDLSGTTDATAILRANSTNNQSETFTYNVYLLIGENTFELNSLEVPELLISIKGPDGDITTIDGLQYFRGFKGFDVTTKKGLYKIATNREINTTGMLEEKWEATVTFRNLNINQAHNGGASFQAKLVLSSEELTLSEYVKLAYEAAPNSTIYYHDSNLANGAEDLSYRYTGPGYVLTDKAISEGYDSIYNSLLVKAENDYYKLAYNPVNNYSEYDFLFQALEDGYIKESNVNNYVCFGSDDETCPDENLYRIIGAFDVNGEYQTKLIKAIPAKDELLGNSGGYYGVISGYYDHLYGWLNFETYHDLDVKNLWSISQLNKTNLNSKDADENSIQDGFIYNIGTEWSSLISNHDWIVGGNLLANIRYNTVQDSYRNEILNYDTTTESIYNDKVGLMYVSDYTYAALPEYWDRHISTLASFPDDNGNYGEEYDYRSSRDDNWLFTFGSGALTITRLTNNTYQVFKISINGIVFQVYSNTPGYIQPTFYLNNDVKIYGGSGTIDNPYRIF